ncbi:3-deoxy-7-phosphoheptulonate synthase [bacterium]|nr:MAG: 3-deoxy-7-phosphoheptulonate synthase [bacterium]RIK63378.1 MAG: 3-deoxy-7-phosphoheptulonate synthase [Planctomycetota bacterium]
MSTALPQDSALVLGTLRASINEIDQSILQLLARRGEVAREVGLAKRLSGLPLFDAKREHGHKDALVLQGKQLGLPGQAVRALYDVLARLGVAAQLPLSHEPSRPRLTPADSDEFRLARAEPGRPQTRVQVGEVEFGSGIFEVIAGPCAVESEAQIEAAADVCRAAGVRLMRGGCFKPRTSPHAFQGHGLAALDWLERAARRRGMAVVTEVLEPADAAPVAAKADMLQIGARNMQNAPLLRACARTGRPVLLKRGAGSSLRELLCAAEYLLAEGNSQVVLCERGIRTFETATRNTLDLSAVPSLRELTHLPVIVDPSHAAGRDEIVHALCRGAWGVGSDGVIVEMHPRREEALSDKRQALTPHQLAEITGDLQGQRVWQA